MACHQLVQSSLRMWENEWYQYQIDLYSEEEFLPRLERMETSMSVCSFKRIWGKGTLYSPRFRKLINDFVEKALPKKCEYSGQVQMEHNQGVKWINFPLHFKLTTYARRYESQT